MEVELFEGIEPDPSVDTVMRGAEAMAKFQPDWIVAIGGGSPIDAANAMYLPKVIAFNAKNETAKKRYGVIADYMGLGGANDDEKVANLIAYLRGMNDALNIPQCIKNYGLDSYPCENGFVPEEIFLERLPEIAKNAVADACTGSNPRAISIEEMEKLLKCCYYDTEVDF